MTPIRHTYCYIFYGQALTLRIKWTAGRVVNIATGLKVEREKWDGKRCAPGTLHGKYRMGAALINSQLEALEARADEFFLKCGIDERNPTPAEVRGAVKGEEGRDASPTFEAMYSQYLREEAQERLWAPNTVKSVKQLGNLVRSMSPDLKISEITEEWLSKFVNYQKNNKLKRGISGQTDTRGGYANSVIMKNCRVLRWFLRWLADRDMLSKSLADGWAPSLKAIAKPVIFLNTDELAAVMKLDLSELPALDHARDIFLLSCFTGLRYSDVINLRKTDVKPNHIELTTIKTGSLLRIELNTFARGILAKYAAEPGPQAVPRLDDHQLNKRLKEIGKMAGIDEPVTITQYYGARRQSATRPKYDYMSSHVGRRTFICTALAMGISPVTVMKWTGHSDYSAMKPYIDIADRTRRESMDRFNTLFPEGEG